MSDSNEEWFAAYGRAMASVFELLERGREAAGFQPTPLVQALELMREHIREMVTPETYRRFVDSSGELRMTQRVWPWRVTPIEHVSSKVYRFHAMCGCPTCAEVKAPALCGWDPRRAQKTRVASALDCPRCIEVIVYGVHPLFLKLDAPGVSEGLSGDVLAAVHEGAKGS